MDKKTKIQLLGMFVIVVVLPLIFLSYKIYKMVAADKTAPSQSADQLAPSN